MKKRRCSTRRNTRELRAAGMCGGNQNSNNPRGSPAGAPGKLLTVAATNMDDERANYSNYGP